MDLQFSGEMWFWKGPAPWYFVTVPEEECDQLEATPASVSYGWGMIPVTAEIGATNWTTSLFPKDGPLHRPGEDVGTKGRRTGRGRPGHGPPGRRHLTTACDVPQSASRALWNRPSGSCSTRHPSRRTLAVPGSSGVASQSAAVIPTSTTSPLPSRTRLSVTGPHSSLRIRRDLRPAPPPMPSRRCVSACPRSPVRGPHHSPSEAARRHKTQPEQALVPRPAGAPTRSSRSTPLPRAAVGPSIVRSPPHPRTSTARREHVASAAAALGAGRQRLGQAVCEQDERVQSRSSASTPESVAAAPEGSLDGVELGPSLDTFAIEFRGLG